MSTPVKRPTWAFASDDDDDNDEGPEDVVMEQGKEEDDDDSKRGSEVTERQASSEKHGDGLIHPTTISEADNSNITTTPLAQKSTPKVTLRIPSQLVSTPTSTPLPMRPSSPTAAPPGSDGLPFTGGSSVGGATPKATPKPRARRTVGTNSAGTSGGGIKGGRGKKASNVTSVVQEDGSMSVVESPSGIAVAPVVAPAKRNRATPAGSGKNVAIALPLPSQPSTTASGARNEEIASDGMDVDQDPSIDSSAQVGPGGSTKTDDGPSTPLPPDATQIPLEGPSDPSRPALTVSSSVPTPSAPTGTKDKKEGATAASGGGYGAGGVGGLASGSMPHVMRKEDGELLSRQDVQYDLLQAIFNDPTQAFTVPILYPASPRPRPTTTATATTSPSSSPSLNPTESSSASAKMTFSQLYSYTISSSPRVTKQIKECLLDLQPGELPGKAKPGMGVAALAAKKKAAAAAALAASTAGVGGKDGPVEEKPDTDELAPEEVEADDFDGLKEGYTRMCLLINFSRINTTYAFYPEMKTILRAYHSIPSFQRTAATRKGLQDAPRLKNGMKSVKLRSEGDHPPESLAEILQAQAAGKRPSTTVCNLIFAMALSADTILYEFPQFMAAGTDFLALWTPVRIAAAQRARAILYIIYYYLESSTEPNPFAEDGNPRGFSLDPLSKEDYLALNENVDQEPELLWGEQMRANRQVFLDALAAANAAAATDSAKRVKQDGTAEHARNEGSAVISIPIEKAKRMRGKGKAVKTEAAILLPPPTRKRKRVGEMVVDMQQDSPQEAIPAVVERDESMHQTTAQPRHIDKVPSDRRWISRVDTSGIDDATLERLVEQVELDMGPPPRISPELDWREWEARCIVELGYDGESIGRGEQLAHLPDTRSTHAAAPSHLQHRSHPGSDRERGPRSLHTRLNGDALPLSSPPPPKGLRALLN